MSTVSLFDRVESERDAILGRDCVLHLSVFVIGVETVMTRSGATEVPWLKYWCEFRYHVMAKYKNRNSYALGLFEASVSPKASLDLFFDEWHEWEKERPMSELALRTRLNIPPVYSLLPILEDVQRRPFFRLCSKTPTQLKAFISGIIAGVEFFGQGTSVTPNLKEFERWLRGEDSTKCPWDMLLIQHSGGDEGRGFDLFFRCIAEFVEREIGEVENRAGLPQN